jgi:hypothetical protein
MRPPLANALMYPSGTRIATQWAPVAALARADHLHDPGLARIADAERLAGAAVAVRRDQPAHLLDALARVGRALQRQAHQVPVVEQAVGIGQFIAAAGRRLGDRYLPLVLQVDHRPGVRGVGDLPDHLAAPVPDLLHRARFVIAGRQALKSRVELAVAGVSDEDGTVDGGSGLQTRLVQASAPDAASSRNPARAGTKWRAAGR